MTGPASGGSERGTGAPLRSTGTQGAVGAVLVVLALGLALRVIIAYLLPGSGFEVDLGAFRYWAYDLATNGLHGFYERDFFHDYTPGYLYVLWLVGTVGAALGGIGDLIKVPPILADLAIGWLVWSMARELGVRSRLALFGALVAVLNPISWFDSVVWGQVDAFGVVFVLLALRALWRDQPERAAVLTVIAAIIKPQLGILVPLVAVVTIRRALWPVGDGRGEAVGRVASSIRERLLGWERRTGSPLRILTTGLAGFLTAVVLSAPFGLSVIEISPTAPYVTSGLVEQIAIAGGGYPYLTVNAYNPWALVPSDLGLSLANTGSYAWVCDAGPTATISCDAGVAALGPVPAVAIGAGLLLLAMGAILWIAARNPDRLTLLVALTLLALAFFVLPTRVHERYGFPAVALGAILFAVSGRWRVAYVVLSVATFANMYVVLTTLYPDNPSISDWLGVGPLIRSAPGVATVAILQTVVFAWAALQLRARARHRLAAELRAASAAPILEPDDSWWEDEATTDLPPARPVPLAAPRAATAVLAAEGPPVARGDGPAHPVSTAPVTAATAAVALPTMPTWSQRHSFMELGFAGWLRDRLGAIPLRPDRSAELVGERGGRLDRIDALILVVLVLAMLGMRTFRLAEPYRMHFDEVYHARTAAEFLQAWRYGISHNIYEWTHPHLAKYLMAAGIAVWGENDVRATSSLGLPVRAAAHEPRREAGDGGRAGERAHVTSGDEIRTYDLRTRALVGQLAAPGSSALAVDGLGGLLVIGYDDGKISTVDLETIGTAATEPVPLGRVDGPVTDLLVTEDGATVVAATDAGVRVLDAASGELLGAVALDGVAAIAEAGTGTAVAATPGAVEDPATVATTLAGILGGDAADYEARITGATDPDAQVVLGIPGEEATRTEIDEAIGDGRLAGVEVIEVPMVAAATPSGVTFVEPATAAEVATVPLEGGARGLALVTGLEDPKLYVTTGLPGSPGYARIAVGGDDAKNGPVSLGVSPLPGPGTRIAYDEATQQVHVLGHAPVASGSDPGAAPWTVYVIEPHGNAVYADAALPATMTPGAWLMDVEPDYMTDDRQDLLVFGADGTTASIELGSNAFAWRLPGVLFGALGAVCVYLLARILFRRRLVAGLAAVFVLLDGMLFVQSRIGMNDVYVGAFILAAYALFAAIWTGWWRWRRAFWVAMPVIGLLLGLALASKWVAAYAIGALVLLLLARSALGRVLAILGMIGLTSVLGYLAITVPEGGGFGNLTFLLIMIGLTLLGVAINVMHPIAWSDEELWFSLLAPAAAGTLVFLAGTAVGRADTEFIVGPLAVTPTLLALGLALVSPVIYVLYRVAGQLGFGPLAPPPGPGDPARLLEPPSPSPRGWLRPGWLLGLPIAWAAVCLVALPLGVYVGSYLPWAMIEDHQLWAGFPVGHTGQTLLDLTGGMYNYHNSLTSAHAASSPWWAWPFDLKPVWFYQESFAAATSAAIYNAGNLVIWWLGVPAMAFAAVMAYRRRSLALALITIGFAAQWIPWARIDRAAFQYHYYTALPFVVLALAYLVAELWHGPSRRTWLAARLVAAAAIIAPAAMWVLSRPLCAFVGVESVNPGSQACPAVIPEAVITARTIGLLIVVAIGTVALARAVLALESGDARESDDAGRGAFWRLALTAIAVAVGFGVAALLPETAVVTLTGIPVEPIAFIIGLPLAYLAATVLAARDARRFVIGLLSAVVAWFAVVYPNISALPLPSVVVNAYQGLLPTYLYAFQFPVSTADRTLDAPLLSPALLVLVGALTVTCVVVAYSAWVWRLTMAGSATANAEIGSSSGDASAGGLARSGGGA